MVRRALGHALWEALEHLTQAGYATQPASRATPQHRLSVDELMDARLPRPASIAPVSLADIERAISEPESNQAAR